MADRISVILLNLLNGVLDLDGKDPNVEPIVRQLGLDPEDAEVNSRIADDARAVREQLFDEKLRRRYNLKRSSKAPSFNQVDWDIKVKRYDAKVEIFEPFPYATFRLSFQRDFDDSPFAVFGGRTFDSVQVNFSRDEIDYLVRVLSAASRQLATLEEDV